MRICQRCVMDESDPETKFYEDGTCSHCRYYFEVAAKYVKPIDIQKALGTGDLFRLVQNIKADGRDKKYDAVLGISGGTDSSYTALIAHKLGFRVLLESWSNGYDDPRATENIRRIVKRTGFDIQWDTVDLQEFHDLQLAYLRSGVVDLEVPSDHAIVAMNYRTAARHKIKYLLSGSNMVTEAIQPKVWGHRKYDLPNLRDIHRRYGKGKLRTFPKMGLLGFLWNSKVRGISQINLLNYVPYNREIAKQELQRECGWVDYGLKHFENIYTRFYQGYILPTRWGIDKRRSHLSTLICSSQMTREEALVELSKPPYSLNQMKDDKSFILGQLRLTEGEFEKLMKAPKRAHANFSTDEFWYRCLYGARKVLRGIRRWTRQTIFGS